MAPGRNCRLTPSADADMEGIWRYSFEHWSMEQADRYVRDFLDAFADLASASRCGAVVTARPSYRRLLVGSHAIYYRDLSTHIEVVRVLHQGMDPDRHL